MDDRWIEEFMALKWDDLAGRNRGEWKREEKGQEALGFNAGLFLLIFGGGICNLDMSDFLLHASSCLVYPWSSTACPESCPDSYPALLTA